NADMTVAALLLGLGVAHDIGNRGATDMYIGIDGVSTFAAEKLVDRHVGPFAKDVPQGHIDAAEGVAEHGAVAPIGADEPRLKNVFNLERILAQKKRLQVFIDR